VRWQRTLGIASIVLSSLGSVGVVADRATANLPGVTGWTFWGSVIVLGFGIVSQIANQLQVAKRAADSESLAVRCGLYETRLENMLMDDDPRTSVGVLLAEVNALFEKEQYNQVLPTMTDEMKDAAVQWAARLTTENQKYWQLKVKKQPGVRKRPASPPQPEAEPPVNPSGDRTHDI
jgi:hypothetical protein